MGENKLKIDIGCGKNKKEGYIGIDMDPESNADNRQGQTVQW